MKIIEEMYSARELEIIKTLLNDLYKIMNEGNAFFELTEYEEDFKDKLEELIISAVGIGINFGLEDDG